MRLHSIIVAGLLLAPVPAFAQEATPVAPPAASAAPSLSPIVPLPREEAGVSGYRVIAIAAGAVVGVIAVNFLTGGMITPILAMGTEPAMAVGGWAMTPVEAAAAQAATAQTAAAQAAAAQVAADAAAAQAAVTAQAAAAQAAAATQAAAAAAPAAVAVPALAPVAAVAPAPAAAAIVEPAAAGVVVPVVETVSYGYMTAQTAVLAAGAVVGGYVGNMVYGK